MRTFSKLTVPIRKNTQFRKYRKRNTQKHKKCKKDTNNWRRVHKHRNTYTRKHKKGGGDNDPAEITPLPPTEVLQPPIPPPEIPTEVSGTTSNYIVLPKDETDDKNLNTLIQIYKKYDVQLIPTITKYSSGDKVTYNYESLPPTGECKSYMNEFTISNNSKKLYINGVSSCVTDDNTVTSGKNIINAIIEYAKYLGVLVITLLDVAYVEIKGCDLKINTDIGNYYLTKHNERSDIKLSKMLGMSTRYYNPYELSRHSLSIVELIATGNTWYGKNFGFVEVGDASTIEAYKQKRERIANLKVKSWVNENPGFENNINFSMAPFLQASAPTKPIESITLRDIALYVQKIFKNPADYTENDCIALSIFMNKISNNIKIPYDNHLMLILS